MWKNLLSILVAIFRKIIFVKAIFFDEAIVKDTSLMKKLNVGCLQLWKQTKNGQSNSLILKRIIFLIKIF